MSQSTGVEWRDRLSMQSSSNIRDVRENARAILGEIGRLECELQTARAAANSWKDELMRKTIAPEETRGLMQLNLPSFLKCVEKNPTATGIPVYYAVWPTADSSVPQPDGTQK